MAVYFDFLSPIAPTIPNAVVSFIVAFIRAARALWESAGVLDTVSDTKEKQELAFLPLLACLFHRMQWFLIGEFPTGQYLSLLQP